MVISAVDFGLSALLRAAMPLPEEIGDISFEVPDRAWGSQLSNITVNLHLFDVASSSQPPRPAQERMRPDGRIERRPRLPMVAFRYMVTAWAGTVADEHQLLSECLVVLANHQIIPPEHLPGPLAGAVQLALAEHEGRRPGDLWNGLDGRMKPVIELLVTVPIDAQAWLLAPPSVTRIAGQVAALPDQPPVPTRPARATTTRRNPDGSREAVAIAPATPLTEGP